MSVADLLSFFGPWPVVALILGILLLPAITLILIRAGGVKLGPLEISRLNEAVKKSEKAASNLDDLTVAMAESRIVELEVAASQIVTTLSEQDKNRLRSEIAKLRAVVSRLKKEN
jgi:cytochrome c-type biogenesis protein CcmH/NrfG